MAIKDLTKIKKHVFLCNGGSCTQQGANESIAAIRESIKSFGLQDQIHTTRTMCNGRCEDAPVVIIQPEGIWYKHITSKKAESLVRSHLKEGKIMKDNFLFCHK